MPSAVAVRLDARVHLAGDLPGVAHVTADRHDEQDRVRDHEEHEDRHERGDRLLDAADVHHGQQHQPDERDGQLEPVRPTPAMKLKIASAPLAIEIVIVST